MTEDLSFRRKPLTPEQRQARDAARRIEAEKAMRDHEEAQKAFYANKERLRAERLAREAAAREGLILRGSLRQYSDAICPCDAAG
ncbi:hypothetical protein [Bradyrhizobium ottawaense]|uniref:hypothetical protein n=1 Tax=Bradyrhizobium ottawaense TaxID=931866 RepID=UPI003514FBDE